MEIFYWIILLLLHTQRICGLDCFFPIEWRGRWHQNIRVDISHNSISRKGTCVQSQGNRYFMLNKDSGNRKCFRCLVFTQWHPNLLQYKESPCWYEESFDHVCNLITGDSTLHTLVKIPSTPQPCPFQGSYIFSYTNGTMSNVPCDRPVSEVHSCADESMFKFVFKSCPGIPGTYDRVLDFQCLATWDNGDKYLYGSFSEPWMTNQDEYMYRCFMHSFYGTSGDMSMSADPTCQGLQSPTLGVITMTFNKNLNEPRGRCRFPDVLINQNLWRDLSGNLQLEVDTGLQVLRLKNRSFKSTITYSETAYSSTKLVMKCVEKTFEAESIGAHISKTEYLTYVTNDTCDSGYQCVRLVRRDERVLEVYLGTVGSSSKMQCTEDHFDQSTKHILIPDVNDSGQCSIARKGIYSYQDKTFDCSGTVNIGCKTPNEIIVETSCSKESQQLKKVNILNCIYSWISDSKTYIIVQKPGQTAKCLTFRDTAFGIELQSDDSCQSDRWTVDNRYINYLLYTPVGSCEQKSIQSDGTSNQASSLTKNNTVIKDHNSSTGKISVMYLATLVQLIISIAISWR